MLTRKTLETLIVLYGDCFVDYAQCADLFSDKAKASFSRANGLLCAILDLCCEPETKEADNGTDSTGT